MLGWENSRGRLRDPKKDWKFRSTDKCIFQCNIGSFFYFCDNCKICYV